MMCCYADNFMVLMSIIETLLSQILMSIFEFLCVSLNLIESDSYVILEVLLYHKT